MSREDDIEKIEMYYGSSCQINQLGEECAELSMAFSKFHRLIHNWANRMTARDVMGGLIEEIADVQLMIWQVVLLLDCDKEIDKIIDEKIDRMLRRMGATEERRGASDRDHSGQ